MTMFPPAWDYEPPGPAEQGQRGPYSASEMTDYLSRSHYHVLVDEPPLKLDEPIYLSELDTRERHLWLWQIRDHTGRIWCLTVGSGLSPFANDERHCYRWILAEAAEKDEDPSEVLNRRAAELAS